MIFLKTLISFLKDSEYRDLLFTTMVILALGMLMYQFLEGWDWIDALYFSVITLTTVGYGDFSPQTTAGKIFTIFYIILGIGMILTFVHTLYNHYTMIRDKGKQNDLPKPLK